MSSWSHGGDKLLSGSDDTMVRVWLPWENYRMAYAIETGNSIVVHSNIHMTITILVIVYALIHKVIPPISSRPNLCLSHPTV